MSLEMVRYVKLFIRYQTSKVSEFSKWVSFYRISWKIKHENNFRILFISAFL